MAGGLGFFATAVTAIRALVTSSEHIDACQVGVVGRSGDINSEACNGRKLLQFFVDQPEESETFGAPTVEYPWSLPLCGDTPGPNCMRTTAGVLVDPAPPTAAAGSTPTDNVAALNTTAAGSVSSSAFTNPTATNFTTTTNSTTARYDVCIEGDAQFFGLQNPITGEPKPLNKYTKDKYPNATDVQPDGIWVLSDGQTWTCELQEWAGGYDGFWDVNADSGHEPGISEALRQMLGGGNETATEFLTALMDLAQPENLEDGPAGDVIADSGNRTANILKGSEACTSLISVTSLFNCSEACEQPVYAHEVFEMPPKLPEEKYTVCLNPENTTQFFGFMDDEGNPSPQRYKQPDGIWVSVNGTCELEEFCGGFDGYWSTDSTDEHEVGLADATRQMLGVRNDTDGNKLASAFLKTIRTDAQPLDMDIEIPSNKTSADCGERMRNIAKASAACANLIEVYNDEDCAERQTEENKIKADAM